jgi:Amt family ammonium transporter
MFYAGLVHKRNVLSVYMQCFALTCVMSVVWLVCGYSLAFNAEGSSFIGGMGNAMLNGITPDTIRADTTLPELLFFAFQMTFFIITPALIVGTFVERIKFSSMMLFSVIWGLAVYVPVCHMVWGGGSLFGLEGVVDHAGGIVVHITAGLAALVACIMVGPRKNPQPPHNLPMAVIGTGMLWVGWFGFNAGSCLTAGGAAAMTLVVTHLSASIAAIVWAVIEWIANGKPSVLGIITGAIAGLAAITPASGAAGPTDALIIGASSGAICYFFSVKLKNKFRYDDSLDVFGVHGIGGIVGTILVGALTAAASLTTQILASVYTIGYTVIVTFLILKIIDLTIGLRVTEAEESLGLDTESHGETGYNE